MISVQVEMPIGDCAEPYRMMSAILLVFVLCYNQNSGEQRHNSGYFRCFCVRRTLGARGFPPLTRLPPLKFVAKTAKTAKALLDEFS
jgi:hypothetical protein